MSIEGALTMEDFMVHFGTVFNQNFGELRGMLVNQSVKLQKLENIVKQMQSQLQEKISETVESVEEAFAPSPPLPDELLVPEEQFNKGLKQERKEIPSTSTPNPKRKSANLDDDDASSLYEIYCFDCKKSFTRGSGEFTRHIRETSCKPYQCHCGKLFKKKSSLTTHKSTHSTESFACHCGAIFKCEQYLKNHSRRKHTEEGTAAAPPAKRQCMSPIDESNIKIKDEPQEETSIDPMELLKMIMSGVEV